MARSRSSSVFGVLLVLFIFFIALIFLALYSVKNYRGPSFSSGYEMINGEQKGEIAVVEIEGIIMDAKDTIDKLLIAEKAKEVKAIIVRINSPGGAVGPTQEIYQEIRRIDAKRPVYASFGAIAASGGYYIGSAARKIFASPGTLTGSIGVIMQFFDLSKLYNWARISHDTVKSGKYKDAGNPTRGLTKEEKNMMNSLLKGVHEQFIQDIVGARKDRIKGDIRPMAEGQIFSGEDAFKFGLVDELASLWTAGRMIHNELKLKGEFGLKYIKKKKDISIFELFERLENVVTKIGMSSEASSLPMFIYRPNR